MIHNFVTWSLNEYALKFCLTETSSTSEQSFIFMQTFEVEYTNNS